MASLQGQWERYQEAVADDSTQATPLTQLDRVNGIALT